MEVIRTREKVIKKLLEAVLFLSWNNRLGRVLIQKKEIIPTPAKITEVKYFLEKASYTIHIKDRVLLPMGSLSKTRSFLTDIGFYFASVNEGVEVITSQVNEFPQIRFLKLNGFRSEKALIYWFRDLQMDPTSIRDDLQEIKDIIKTKKAGGG